jgi:hypothetical protein
VSGTIEISVLHAPIADRAIEQLASVLVDCVEGGASVSFMAPFSLEEGLAFFRKVAGSVASGDAVLLAAKLDGNIVGSGWTRRRTSRIGRISRKCWCIALRAAAASAPT